MPAYFYHLSLEVLRSSRPPKSPAATSSLALDSVWEALLPFQKRVRPSTATATSRGGDSLAQLTHTPGKEITLERRFNHASASSSSEHPFSSSAHHSPSSSLPANNYPTTSPNSPSDLENDARAGNILIDCIDMVAPDDGSGKRTQKRGSTAVPAAGNEDNLVAAGIGTDILGGLRTKGRYIPLDQEVGESVWGIVHLYRDVQETPYLAGNDDDYPTYLKGSAAAARHPSEQQAGGASRAASHTHGKGSADLTAYPFPVTVSSSGKEEDECSTLCILAVPSYLSPPDFLGFVGQKTMDDVSHFRMIRTPRANRYMVLMKFRNGRKAKVWQKEWNGKVFNSMEVCLTTLGWMPDKITMLTVFLLPA